jgi:hypothetical protein
VTYSISAPSSDVTLTPQTGTISAGQQQVITVTADSVAGYYNTATINPGNITLTIYNTHKG